MTAKVIQVIEATGLVGVGTERNPHRTVTAYFTMAGDLIAEFDPFIGRVAPAESKLTRSEIEDGK